MNDELKKVSLKGAFKVLATLITVIGSITVAYIEHQDAVALREKVSELQTLQVETQEENYSSENAIASLEKRISDLEKSNQALRDEKSELEVNYETVQTNYNAALAEIDRLNERLNNIASAPSPEVIGSAEQRTDVESVNLIEACPPYETSQYSAPNVITMMGETYSNGFSFHARYSGYALFNLNGKYNTLEFDFGHVDGSAMKNVSYNFYLDGKFVQSVDGTPEMRVTHFVVPLNGALQMKIEFGGYGALDSPTYAFVNAILK